MFLVSMLNFQGVYMYHDHYQQVSMYQGLAFLKIHLRNLYTPDLLTALDTQNEAVCLKPEIYTSCKSSFSVSIR